MATINDFTNRINEGWEKIRKNAISKLESYLNTGNSNVMFTKKEYMEYYTTVYNLSTLKQENIQQQLYQRYTESINSYLQTNVLVDLQKLHGDDLLKALYQKWDNHGIMVRWMQRFFQYLDRFYVEINSLTPLTDQGYKIFKNVVFQPLIQNITNAILDDIRKEREGELVDRDILKKIVDIFLFLSTDKLSQESLNCKKYLEDRILEQTKQFYQIVSQNLLQSASLSEYLFQSNKYFNEEKERLEIYLTWDIKDNLLKEFKTEMLLNHQQTLLDRQTGIKFLLENDKFDDLSLLFILYQDHPEYLQPVALAFKEHIQQQGLQLVTKIEFSEEFHREHSKVKELLQSSQLIEQLVQMLEKYVHMVKKCFLSNAYFERSRHTAFEVFMNKDRDSGKITMSELLAVYTDLILRKGGMKISEDKQEDYLEKIVQLFTHLIDKDLFIEVFRSYLAKRLLNEKFQSIELEKSIISYIKMACGPQFTKKLEGMLTDLSLAQEESKKFQEFCSSNNQLAQTNVDFNITILTTSYWPTYKTFDLSIPREIESCIKTFNLYYQQKYNHRILQWCYSLGSSTVNAKFPDTGKSFDCVLGTFQMCIIMLFNQSKELTFKEIKETLKFDDDTCTKNLKSLMMKGYKIIESKSEKSLGTIQDGDVFRINEQFSSQIKRIVFPTPVLEEVYKKEIVQEDRSIAIEAAIVRIMKSRRKLDHTSLVQEVIQTLQMFKPHPQVIKQKIEHLIEREYLERDPDDKSIYRYLA